jgi:hypothetical protein
MLLAAADAIVPSNEEVLARVADINNRGNGVVYSVRREYRIRNARFSQEATVLVHLTHRIGEEKRFTVVRRSGSERLAGIVDKLLAAEGDASRPLKKAGYEISPANYSARIRGMGFVDGRSCYIVDVTPKRKDKFLIQGTLWVERETYGILRLEGSPVGNISIWTGRPDLVQDFREIGGLWLPSYLHAVSSGMLLGTSELEIRYTDYRVAEKDSWVPAREGALGPLPRRN